MVTPSASSTSEPEWGLVNAGGVPPSGGKFQDLLIGDDVILLGSDDGAVGTTFHEITGLWETPSGKRMAAIHRYYTRADFESIECPFNEGLLTRKVVLNSLQPKELVLTNDADECEISGNAVTKCCITHRFQVIFDSDKKQATLVELSQGLFQIHNLAEDTVAKDVALCLQPKWKKNSLQIGHFFLFCYERQMVWERRNDGAYLPWTRSEVLSDYSFCNNYRELDRGTQYFREIMLKRAQELRGSAKKRRLEQEFNVGTEEKWLREVIFQSLIYRLVNKVETFQKFGGIPNTPEEVKKFLEFMTKEMSMNKIVFTGAHQTMGLDRYKKVLNGLLRTKLLDTITEKVWAVQKDLCKVTDQFEIIDNVNKFFSWQITCDLMECGCLPHCTENDYARLGPGALKGIRIIFGDTDENIHVELAKTLQTIQGSVFKALNVTFPYFAGRELTVKHIEHALCEFTKFVEIQNKLSAGITRVSQRYRNSRSALDSDKICRCGKDDDEIFMCDTCNVAYCVSCGEEPGRHWICKSCRELSHND